MIFQPSIPIPVKRKHVPLMCPNSIRQLLKAARKGHVVLREPTRLEKLRYRLKEHVAP